MRLPADEIGHSGRDRLLDDEVVGEARQRTADQDQQRHRQELAAVIVQHLVGAGRAQEIDQRADEAQDRDFDQRNDQADRHQRGEKRPDLKAITPVIAEQARWRHAVVVIAKRIDAGLEEPEHGLVSIRNRGQSRIRKRRRTHRRKRRNGWRNEKKDKDLGVRTKAADASASGHAALTRRGGRPRMPDAFAGEARVGRRRSPDCVESKSFRLPQVRADTDLADH
jgi:hypothetical protein